MYTLLLKVSTSFENVTERDNIINVRIQLRNETKKQWIDVNKVGKILNELEREPSYLYTTMGYTQRTG